ncbi:hypothetical protein Tco_0052529 [Tanacetum coccineum]
MYAIIRKALVPGFKHQLDEGEVVALQWSCAVFLMKLKWRGSYYYLIGKWGQIITGKTLEVGQEIRVRWDNGGESGLSSDIDVGCTRKILKQKPSDIQHIRIVLQDYDDHNIVRY